MPDAIARDTIHFRTLPQEEVPVEPQAKEVTLQTHGFDMYKRTLADVLLPDGPTSITSLLETAGAGGIGSMRRGILCWRD